MIDDFVRTHDAVWSVRLMHRDHMRRTAWIALAATLLDEAGLGREVSHMAPLPALRRAWMIGEALEEQLLREGLHWDNAVAHARTLFEVASQADRTGLSLGLGRAS